MEARQLWRVEGSFRTTGTHLKRASRLFAASGYDEATKLAPEALTWAYGSVRHVNITALTRIEEVVQV